MTHDYTATLTWHIAPTIAAVDALSAPPDSGNKYPAPPDRLQQTHKRQTGRVLALVPEPP
eukprot:1144949-Pelagomonas_calceolata.AAC.4